MNDLKPSDLEPLSDNKVPDSAHVTVQSLESLFVYVIKKVNEAINWYYYKRKGKRTVGLFLRYSSIGLIALAGILPILITIFKTSDINPSWSAVVVGLAALMIGIDKFGGFTSGWIRYVVAAQKLNEISEEFRFNWHTTKLRLRDIDLSSDEIQSLTKTCQEFLQKAQSVVAEETQKWVAEFQSALNDIESSAKASAESAKAAVKAKEEGAVAISVSNGVSCDNPWSISLDGKFVSSYSGSSAALSNLKPGIVVLKIAGIIKSKNVVDEKPVIVKGGEISSVTMTLI